MNKDNVLSLRYFLKNGENDEAKISGEWIRGENILMRVPVPRGPSDPYRFSPSEFVNAPAFREWVSGQKTLHIICISEFFQYSLVSSLCMSIFFPCSDCHSLTWGPYASDIHYIMPGFLNTFFPLPHPLRIMFFFW